MNEQQSDDVRMLLLVMAVMFAPGALLLAAPVFVAVSVLVWVLVAIVSALLLAVLLVVNPKLSVTISIIVIVLSLISLFYTLPIASNLPQTIEVICQQTTTQTAIFIHASTTQIITHTSVVNSTAAQVISKVSCP